MALVLWLGLLLGDARTPESRESVAATPRAMIVAGTIASLLLALPLIGALALVVLGLLPAQSRIITTDARWPELAVTVEVIGEPA